MKRKTIKKVVSMLATASMIATLAGCGTGDKVSTEQSAAKGSEETKVSEMQTLEEDVTIRVYLSDAKGSDLALVSEAVSELTQAEYGFSVELVQFGAGEYAQKMPLALIGDEQVDIFFSSGDTFVEYVSAGALYNMTDALEEHEGLKNAVHNTLWELSAVDGEFYGVPTNKEVGNAWRFLASRKLIEDYDIDITKIHELADWEEYLFIAVENGHYGLMYPSAGWHTASAWYDDYAQLVGNFMVPIADGDDEVCYWWMTDQAAEFAALMEDWANKGYIRSDALVNGNYEVSVDTFGIMGNCGGPRYDADWITVPMTENRASDGRGALQCIAAKSKYPEQALQFLEMWYTNPELEDLMVYGIEGKHYNIVDGQVEKVENSNNLYLNQSWKGGNMIISTPTTGNPDNIWEEYQEWNDSAIILKTAGFTADISAVAAEAAAVDAVVAEFQPLLITGLSGNAEATLEEFRAALKDAGVDKVIAELQNQWDTFNK